MTKKEAEKEEQQKLKDGLGLKIDYVRNSNINMCIFDCKVQYSQVD